MVCKNKGKACDDEDPQLNRVADAPPLRFSQTRRRLKGLLGL